MPELCKVQDENMEELAVIIHTVGTRWRRKKNFDEIINKKETVKHET